LWAVREALKTHENWGVFTAGICTTVMWTPLLSWSQLGSDRLGETVDRMLRATIGRLQWDAAVAQRRSDLHDSAMVSWLHSVQRDPGTVDKPR